MSQATTKRMPALFVGHGSPMNAVEENAFTRGWREIAAKLPAPKAILAVSAHWYTGGTFVGPQEKPRQVYDMYGFPEELYRLRYPAPGSPALARRTQALLGQRVSADGSWGIDHGAWSVLCRMFPEAEIPVVQLSVDAGAPPETHFALGRALRPLRDEGILLLASGNVVHNLRRVDWTNEAGGYPWADAFDGAIRESILAGRYGDVVDFRRTAPQAELAVPTPDHFYPLLYALGAAEPEDALTVFNDARTLGSLSMTSYLFA